MGAPLREGPRWAEPHRTNTLTRPLGSVWLKGFLLGAPARGDNLCGRAVKAPLEQLIRPGRSRRCPDWAGLASTDPPRGAASTPVRGEPLNKRLFTHLRDVRFLPDWYRVARTNRPHPPR